MHNRWKPHVTVAAVIEREGRFLLVEEQAAEGLLLNHPAGHLEPGEALVDACVREVLEETAYGFTPRALVGIYLTRVPRPGANPAKPGFVSYLRFTFTGELGERDLARRLDHGIVRTVWMTADELRDSAARHRTATVLRSTEDYLAGARFPLQSLHTDLGEGIE